MGMTGILFQIGKPGDLGEQEGVEECDLLEIVYDRLSQLADHLEETDDCLIDTVLLNLENAIGLLAKYAKLSADSGYESET